jgi:hypothetical protein
MFVSQVGRKGRNSISGVIMLRRARGSRGLMEMVDLSKKLQFGYRGFESLIGKLKLFNASLIDGRRDPGYLQYASEFSVTTFTVIYCQTPINQPEPYPFFCFLCPFNIHTQPGPFNNVPHPRHIHGFNPPHNLHERLRARCISEYSNHTNLLYC